MPTRWLRSGVAELRADSRRRSKPDDVPPSVTRQRLTQRLQTLGDGFESGSQAELVALIGRGGIAREEAAIVRLGLCVALPPGLPPASSPRAPADPRGTPLFRLASAGVVYSQPADTGRGTHLNTKLTYAVGALKVRPWRGLRRSPAGPRPLTVRSAPSALARIGRGCRPVQRTLPSWPTGRTSAGTPAFRKCSSGTSA